MTDLALVAVVVAFFLACAAHMALCDRISAEDRGERP